MSRDETDTCLRSCPPHQSQAISFVIDVHFPNDWPLVLVMSTKSISLDWFRGCCWLLFPLMLLASGFSISITCRKKTRPLFIYVLWYGLAVLASRFGVVMVCVFAARLIEFCVPNLCCFSAAKARFYFCVLLLRTSLAHSLVLVVAVVAVVVDFFGPPASKWDGRSSRCSTSSSRASSFSGWVGLLGVLLVRGCPHQLEVVKELVTDWVTETQTRVLGFWK